MEETIQCLPQELRTLHPKRWSTENVSAWVTAWGSSFRVPGETLLQNGVDGRTIHDALSETSQSPLGDVTSLQGEQIHKHVYVIVACPLSSHLCPNMQDPWALRVGRCCDSKRKYTSSGIFAPTSRTSCSSLKLHPSTRVAQ